MTGKGRLSQIARHYEALMYLERTAEAQAIEEGEAAIALQCDHFATLAQLRGWRALELLDRVK